MSTRGSRRPALFLSRDANETAVADRLAAGGPAADGIPDHLNQLVVLRHRDEAGAGARYPWHASMSTTVLARHRTAGVDRHGRVGLIVERQGSLPGTELRRLVEPLGFCIVLGPHAATGSGGRTVTPGHGGPTTDPSYRSAREVLLHGGRRAAE